MPEPKPHPGGRPLLFATAEELKAKCDEFFEKKVGWVEFGTKTIWLNGEATEVADRRWIPATLSGLASHLGVDRKTLLNYRERPEFFPVLAHARAVCEKHLEEGALIGQLNANFAKHVSQNNFGWVDKTEVKSKVEVIGKLDLSKLPDNVIDDIIAGKNVDLGNLQPEE